MDETLINSKIVAYNAIDNFYLFSHLLGWSLSSLGVSTKNHVAKHGAGLVCLCSAINTK